MEAAERAELAAGAAAGGEAAGELEPLVERMETEYARAAEELARRVERIDPAEGR
jgi:hypothetical protein